MRAAIGVLTSQTCPDPWVLASHSYVEIGMHRIAITGSEGLIGRHLRTSLMDRQIEVVAIDHALPVGNPGRIDLATSDISRELSVLFEHCDGIIHLGAVSRVVWGERDPARCWRTNVEGTEAVLHAAAQCQSRPWVLFASSREVYGDAERLPVAEDAPLLPLNAYARSKVAAEERVLAARVRLRTAIVRLSSVYGDVLDHADRVVPAFTRAAAEHGVLRIEGADNVLDLTYAPDVADGLLRLITILSDGESALPPIHLVSGHGTTLGGLANLARAAGGGRSQLMDAPPRTYDVARFFGDPSRARSLLGWEARTTVEVGVMRMVQEYIALNARRAASAPGVSL